MMSKNKLFLMYRDEFGSEVTRSVEGLGDTWEDILEEVKYFLRGAGFIIEYDKTIDVVDNDGFTGQISKELSRESW